jgi:hypothetical protein
MKYIDRIPSILHFVDIESRARLLCLIALLGCCVCAHAASKYQFSMPAQPLADALEEVANKANLQLVYSSALVRGKSTQLIAGSMSASEAFDQLLLPFGLRSEYLDPQTVMISAAVAPQGESQESMHERPVVSDTAALASAARPAPLDKITVQGERGRDQLKNDVHKFLASAAIHYNDATSMARWNTPVCPMVAGFTRDQGEYILGQLSQIARAAQVPLGSSKCAPNLYIVVTSNPEATLKLWNRKYPHLFDTSRGEPEFKDFIESPRPVRVWYNGLFKGADGNFSYSTSLWMASFQVLTTQAYDGGSRLKNEEVWELQSVFVIVDKSRLEQVNIGQLSGYVGLTSFAQIHLDGDLGQVPSILHLFKDKEYVPQAGMSDWDRGFLWALYSTGQSSVTQYSQVQTKTLDFIVGTIAR